LKYHPAGKISVFNLLVPVFGTVLSGVVLREDILRIETFLALALISLGIFLVNYNKRSREDD
jgi:drug/metabolite transporter (DMT)-like permease